MECGFLFGAGAEGDWKVAKIEDDSEFLNAMFGGMIDIVKEFEKFGDSLNVD